MIRSFIFSQGKLVSQNVGLDVLRVMLYDEDVQIWLDAEQPTEEETKSLLEGIFNFHPLAIEDCVNVSERPKIDEYENYIFMVIHAVDFSAHEFRTTELNMFVGKNFLLTYHRDPIRSVTATIDRVMKNAPLVARAPDRLTYTLLDFLLENYRPALEELAAEIAELEKRILESASSHVLSEILQLKGEVQRLRQIIAPQREVVARVAHGEFKVVRAHMLPYYRDLSDHLARISDTADNYRDSLTNTLQVHLNLQQMQVNRVIKVVTVLATLSVPILVITSFYGMNLNHFPPMGPAGWDWKFAYLWVFGITAFWTALIYVILKWRKWM